MIYEILDDVYTVGLDAVMLKDFSQYSLLEFLLLGILLCQLVTLFFFIWRNK